MFAVVRTGGKQYRVAADQKIIVDRMVGEAGDAVSLDDVLLIGDGEGLKSLDGQVVSAEIVAQFKGDKVIVFKKKRRHNYRRKNGHRQLHTLLKITAIGEQKAAPKKAAKAEAAPAAAPVEAAPAAEAAAPAPKKAAAPKVKAETTEAAAPKAAKPKATKTKAAPPADAE